MFTMRNYSKEIVCRIAACAPCGIFRGHSCACTRGGALVSILHLRGTFIMIRVRVQDLKYVFPDSHDTLDICDHLLYLRSTIRYMCAHYLSSLPKRGRSRLRKPCGCRPHPILGGVSDTRSEGKSSGSEGWELGAWMLHVSCAAQFNVFPRAVTLFLQMAF